MGHLGQSRKFRTRNDPLCEKKPCNLITGGRRKGPVSAREKEKKKEKSLGDRRKKNLRGNRKWVRHKLVGKRKSTKMKRSGGKATPLSHKREQLSGRLGWGKNRRRQRRSRTLR